MSEPKLASKPRTARQFVDRLDDLLGTRPLFALVFSSPGLPLMDRGAAALHTLRTIGTVKCGQLLWAVRENVGQVLYKRLRGGRPGVRGLASVEHPGNQGWHRTITLSAVHRCRIALGRLVGPPGRASVTLFCGYHPKPGELPVYVLLSDGRIYDMAFVGEDGGISPGVGIFASSPIANREALMWLSAHLAGGEPDEDAVGLFLDRG